MRIVTISPDEDYNVKTIDEPYWAYISQVVGGLPEVVRFRDSLLPKGICMVDNDNGLSLNLKPNFFGSLLYRYGPIVGTIVLFREELTNEGSLDIVDMTDEDLEKIKDLFMGLALNPKIK